MYNQYEVILPKDVTDFLSELEESAENKFMKAFDKVEKGVIREEYFKKLSNTDGIWEFRIQDKGKWYRILAFFAGGKIILTTHGFQKKGNKTPKKEIDIAERIKKDIKSK
ncbi:hypothetical protein ADIARSV_1221 [Arcticibacter svalbardensis MN12-7]|uniref:Phage-related protein n=1 Tax=Arcticibacter svalbardensis MN12-7 TaxID=1150600 RepID=R9GVS8_9SPHI|nr:type II toxin-antitoxin system RelE/ParE family toxin [Arcticibacter svalbardensis]EOR95615.1 hypothetical protein ADIARSV_1221 [Arcticibacter svalbardensis MN12-7]